MEINIRTKAPMLHLLRLALGVQQAGLPALLTADSGKDLRGGTAWDRRSTYTASNSRLL
jgi:hypothetical protein